MTGSRCHASIYYVARLVLVTQTPLSIAEGHSSGLYDNLIVRDANNLPAIPGSSLAGVLRALYAELYDNKAEADDLFGLGQEWSSYVHVSWSCLHNRHDIPIEGLQAPNTLEHSEDPLIQDALQAAPLRRDHVKLNHRGISDTEKKGKFDRTSLTAGHRFSAEIALWSEQHPDPRWDKLLSLFSHPRFRLGGNTRRGLGKIKVVRCATGCFQLGLNDKAGQELARFSQLQQSLAATPELIQKSVLTAHHLETPIATEMIELYLTPLAEGFRFGGLNKAWDARNHEADAVSLIEKQVTWPPENQGGYAKIQDRALLFPASSFKGALSHRVAYHYNLLTGIFADDDKDAQTIEAECAENTAVRELFGYVEEDKSKEQIARAGCLLFDDFYLTDNLQAVKLPHSGIDRFTGGVRDGVLFFEEVMTCEQPLPPITLVLTQSKSKFKPETITALERTLDDLCNGYLALGAGSGRGGYGYFTGIWNWLAKPREEKQNAA